MVVIGDKLLCAYDLSDRPRLRNAAARWVGRVAVEYLAHSAKPCLAQVAVKGREHFTCLHNAAGISTFKFKVRLDEGA